VSSYLASSDETVYNKNCKKHGSVPESETLADGTKGYWIGPKSAEKIVFNCHGGGYVLPAEDAMFEYMWQIQTKLKAQGTDAAVLFLGYSMSISRSQIT
jgi:hypothetical protein